jgi:FtsP/CotA-like multicopper oxidase with cupredoxin domain
LNEERKVLAVRVAVAEGKTHKITLTARRSGEQLTYNGAVPGPNIEIVEGDTVELTLVNELDVAVSVHVHGVHYDITSDGTRHSNSFAPRRQYTTLVRRAGHGRLLAVPRPHGLSTRADR